ncbi:MAG TPA: diguanylate cyclase [Patescibacteria group bacterium]|nr:diguanylate cyclase [Patescibacteria group bacterium]
MRTEDPAERTAVKVLVIGPDQPRIASISSRLSALGFNCQTALASPTSLRGGLLHTPDVIAAIEVGGSWQPARRLLEMDLSQLHSAAPPVLVIAEGVGPAERSDALASRESGVHDWVDASCPDREIAARLTRLARWKRMSSELEELRRRCAEMETVDRLTGLPNHRAFQEYLAVEFRRAERYKSPLSLILFDIDRFRFLNDTFGHLWGDRVIQSIARGLRTVVREVDMAARYGGEEFAVVLPESDARSALAVAGRVRGLVDDLGARLAETQRSETPTEAPVRITISLGTATWPDEGTATRGLLLAAAEAALRRAKDEGRNRTVAHAAPASSETPPIAAPAARGGHEGGSGWSG